MKDIMIIETLIIGIFIGLKIVKYILKKENK